MKKIISLILAIGMILCLCACGSEDTQNPVDDTKPESSQNDESSQEEETPKFTVTVVDQNGDPVEGALVKICQGETCLMPMSTDENGVVEFNFELSDGHKLALENCPEGYETEYMGDNYTYIEDGETEFTFEITKK